MMFRELVRSVTTVSILLGACCRGSTAEVVYDSIGQGPTVQGVLFGGHHFFASLVQLDGMARRVESVELNLHARDASITTDVSAAIHLNDADGLIPGSLLWESSPHGFLLTTSSLQRVAIDVPYVTVPEQLWVVVSVAHILSSGSPVIFRDNPQGPLVGERLRSILKSINSEEWSSREPGGYAMIITAVPEPSTWALMIVGLAVVPLLRRRES